MFDFIDTKTMYTISHVFSAIIGAGGAFVSDSIFFNSIRNGRIDRHELRFMKLGGKIVWVGLFLLIISGSLLVSTDLENFLSSDKFLAKLSIVAIIIVNGIIFHRIHIPNIHDHLGLKLSNSVVFMKKSSFLVASGVISAVSWTYTVILGMLKNIPYNYSEIMGIYIFTLAFIVAISISMKKSILHLR